MGIIDKSVARMAPVHILPEMVLNSENLAVGNNACAATTGELRRVAPVLSGGPVREGLHSVSIVSKALECVLVAV